MRVRKAGGAAGAVLAVHGAAQRRRLLLIALLSAFTLISVVADLVTGPAGLDPGQLWGALAGDPQVPRASHVIVWEIRLPMALMAVAVGAALALAGAEMQTILDNPLASPFTLGVSSAASFGAALAIVLGLGLPFVPAELLVTGNAFVFAFGATLLLQYLARDGGGRSATLVLYGIALVFTFNALIAFIQFVASAEALQRFVFWGMGNLAAATWPSVAMLAAVLAVVLPFSLAAAWDLTALRFGEDRARSYGIDTARLRFLSLLRASLLAATAVAVVGAIGFVGLVGPHVARLLVGEDHRFFLPASALTGALIMSLASTASKLVIPGLTLPVGIVTSIVGLPLFFILIHRRARRG